MRAILLVLALVVGVSPVRADSVYEIKSGDLTIQIAGRTEANFVYQLDCLAKLITCTNDVFERLWHGQLGINAEDERKIRQWAKVRSEVRRNSYSGDRSAAVKTIIPVFDDSDSTQWARLRWAEFGAADAAAVRAVWFGSLPAEAASRLAEIAEHFRPRFDGWWKEHESGLSAFTPGIDAAMRKGRAGELLNAAARFYRSDLGDRRVFVHLFLQPKQARPNSRATRTGPHMAVEVVSGEQPRDRVDVITHELAHHIFGSMPPERKAELIETLFAMAPAGVSAWNLFNEVQATVIGNVLVARNALPVEQFKLDWDRPRAFYADDAIDLGARASFGLFERAFAKRERLRPAFVKDFVAALQSGLGERLLSPGVYLRSVVVNVEKEDSPWPGKFGRAVNAWSVRTVTDLGGTEVAARLDRYSGLSAIAFASPEQVSKLARASASFGLTAEALNGALGTSRGIVLMAQRSTLAYSVAFVAYDDAVMDGLLSAFPACQLKPGVCVRIE